MSSNDFKTASTNLKMLSFSGGKPTLFSCVPFTVTVISSLLTDSQHNVSVVIIGCLLFALPPTPNPWEVKSKKKNFFFLHHVVMVTAIYPPLLSYAYFSLYVNILSFLTLNLHFSQIQTIDHQIYISKILVKLEV